MEIKISQILKKSILFFLKSTSDSLFNIGSNTLKQFKVCNTAPVELNLQSNKLAALDWQARTLILGYHDGRKFCY